MRRLLIWLSGANSQILQRCPTDRAKYVGIGSAVLTTALMAATSCAFALHMALQLPIASCLLIGGAWGLAIMSLDRWLVASVQRREHWYQNLVVALPRLVLAVLIGLVISTPLVLRIFEPEIQAEMVTIHRERADEFDRAMQNDERTKQIGDLRTQQAQLQATVAAGGVVTDVNRDPEVARLQPQVDAARTRYNDAEQAVVCEKEGRPGCGSGRPGAGVAYDEKVTIRDRAGAELARLQRQLDAAISAAQANQNASRATTLANAQSELERVNTQLDSLERSRAADIAAFNAENSDDTGMLIRIEALDRLTSERPSLGRAHLLLLLFITAIECLPVLVKFLMSLGVPTLYERAVEIEERNQLQIEEEQGRRRRATEILNGGDTYLEAQIGREERDAAIERLTRSTIQAQADIAERILARWRERELRRIEADLDSYLVTGSRSAPNTNTRPRGMAPDYPHLSDLPSQPTRVQPPTERHPSDGRADPSTGDEPFPADRTSRVRPPAEPVRGSAHSQARDTTVSSYDGQPRHEPQPERDDRQPDSVEDEPVWPEPWPAPPRRPTPPREPVRRQEEPQLPAHTIWWEPGGDSGRTQHPLPEDVTRPTEATRVLADDDDDVTWRTPDSARPAGQPDARPWDPDEATRDAADRSTAGRRYAGHSDRTSHANHANHAGQAGNQPRDPDEEPTWVPRTDGGFGPRADTARSNGWPADLPDTEGPTGRERST
ncbi:MULTISPECIES: DUF4407 domain-containing protein [Protofrankia]|uniref:DUF4407 domain-containing protein n=1 Tax=Candidatus Protofrankia datiscae TaxID=2716812 RepID=F8AZD7_9ACTN|nr:MULTISPECIES: DUF4407 domain-containing protein [Protofrankia]AEH11671.1 hypothetical protein FsymDg_4421 [Candidatus Protofrankia datiscae]